MKIYFLRVLFFSLVFAVCSCHSKKQAPKLAQGGVVLTFDDAYVDEWFQADSVLKKYKWKGTFCTCRIDSIGAPQQAKLLQLQKEGHEIAGHGYHHYNAVDFVASHGMEAYLKEEIDPMLVSMKKRSLKVCSFAYPYGERSDALDSALYPKFSIIRGRAFCGNAPEKEGCYFRNSKYQYAFDIDNSHVHFSIPYLLELLDDAKKRNKILILCSHKTVKEVTGNYQTKFETLEFVCKYMKLNHMKFYTLADLGGFMAKKNK